MFHVGRSDVTTQELLSELAEELLEAHVDTMMLASELRDTSAWDRHLDYLRGLQRVGYETLARAAESHR